MEVDSERTAVATPHGEQNKKEDGFENTTFQNRFERDQTLREEAGVSAV